MKILFAIIALALALTLLCVRVICKKDGRFSSQHIAGNRLMRSRGIHCAVSQDREVRQTNENKINVKQL